MRHYYLSWAILLGLAGPLAHGQATAWQPFRPGMVYAFGQAGGPVAHVHTLRVDSAYTTAGGDSVYAFNRLLRPANGTTYPLLKSRNNLLGARLRWRPGTHDYYLEANAEPALGGPAAPVALLLRPRVAVGSTWPASVLPALTATLTSRVLGLAGTTPDSVATITLSNGQVLTLSQHYGLLRGPQWLTLAGSSGALPADWQQYGLPQAGLGAYDPRRLFSLSVGDELGYELAAPFLAALPCQTGYRLRRIVGRQLTADSLVLAYQEQDLLTTSNMPGCTGTPGTVLGPSRPGRWAFSLRTGASPQWILGLLAGEYRPAPSPIGSADNLLLGQGYDVQASSGSCLDTPELLHFAKVYGPASGVVGQYLPGLDYLAVNQYFSLLPGMGPTYFTDYYANRLTYYRRGGVICGQPTAYAGLLPTRAALAAAAGSLAPNPAAERATLTLASPAPADTYLVLTDAVGRPVWNVEVPVGSRSLAVPLAGRPAGLYLVQLVASGAGVRTWKLVKQ